MNPYKENVVHIKKISEFVLENVVEKKKVIVRNITILIVYGCQFVVQVVSKRFL